VPYALVALLRKKTCNLRHPMHLRHPVDASGHETFFANEAVQTQHFCNRHVVISFVCPVYIIYIFTWIPKKQALLQKIERHQMRLKSFAKDSWKYLSCVCGICQVREKCLLLQKGRVFFCKKRSLLVKETCVLLSTDFSFWKREVSSVAEGTCLLLQKKGLFFGKRDVTSLASRGLFLQKIKHTTCNMTHLVAIRWHHTKWQPAKRSARYIGGRVWLVVNREISPWLVVNREISWFHQPRFPLMRLNLIKNHFRSVLCLTSWGT